MIPISATMGAAYSDKTKGSKLEENTGKSIKFRSRFINNNFDHIRIYRLFYENSGQLPTIHIITEQEIISANTVIVHKIRVSLLKSEFSYLDINLLYIHTFMCQT